MWCCSQGDAQTSAVVAERIRESIAAYQMDINGSMVSITISAGVAECLISTDTLDKLTRRADEAMYAAKRAGRNRTVIFGPDGIGAI